MKLYWSKSVIRLCFSWGLKNGGFFTHILLNFIAVYLTFVVYKLIATFVGYKFKFDRFLGFDILEMYEFNEIFL